MRILLAFLWVGFSTLPAGFGQDQGNVDLAEKAECALHLAVDFFRNEVSTQGGYLWRYSEDLATREGEGKATDTQVWVQPPGTPAVGLALLRAYEATGDPRYLDVAVEACEALVRGQLRSGGWYYRIEFDPENRKDYAYLVDPPRKDGQNTSTLDDNTTQSALRLLMQVDQALGFRNTRIHGAVRYCLHQLLAAQYPNGAWPQRFSESPNDREFPTKKADYPESWSRTFLKDEYRSHYTFNDNAIGDMVDVMLEAAETYGKSEFLDAAKRAGDFILLAQMPEPQPAWAQQYDRDMHPAWARKFEPPSITGGESQEVMRTLLTLYQATGDPKYLEPIPRAIDYFRSSLLPDGRLARFYELRTNRPLFFTKDYELTYSDSDMPTHYNFKPTNGIEAIAQEYEKLLSRNPQECENGNSNASVVPSNDLGNWVRQVIDSLDEKGRWVEDGRMRYHGDDDPTRRIIDCRTFIANVGVLCQYLSTVNPDLKEENHPGSFDPVPLDQRVSAARAVRGMLFSGEGGFNNSPMWNRCFSLGLFR